MLVLAFIIHMNININIYIYYAMFIGYLIHAELQVDPELLLGQAADDFTAGTAASGKRRKLREKKFGWFLPWFLRCIPRIRDWFTSRRSSFSSIFVSHLDQKCTKSIWIVWFWKPQKPSCTPAMAWLMWLKGLHGSMFCNLGPHRWLSWFISKN